MTGFVRPTRAHNHNKQETQRKGGVLYSSLNCANSKPVVTCIYFDMYALHYAGPHDLVAL